MDEVEKRFACDECGHSFVMECEEDMIRKFCPFCSQPVFVTDETRIEWDEDNDHYPFGD